MASDESMTIRSCISMHEGHHYDDDTDDGYDHQPHPHSLSRLSICTKSSIYDDEEEEDDDGPDMDDHYANYYYQGQDQDHQDQGEQQSTAGMNMYMSLLSVDGFDGDIDEEMLSSTDKRPKQVLLGAGLSSDSDKEPGYYSLPATPPRRPRPDQSTAAAGAGGMLHHSKHPNPMVKEYASENEAQTTIMSDDSRRNARSSRKRSRRRIMNNRHSWLSPPSDRGNLAKKKNDNDHDEDEEENKENMNCMMRTGSSQLGHCHSFSGESEGGSCTGTGVVVITRPKGGRRSLCMDLEEVKACRDLGFELEHQHMLQEMPSRLSLSASTHDTNTTCSSGGNSPIANWRISSPGDNPREVKARLKVWAQAVALASTSRQGI